MAFVGIDARGIWESDEGRYTAVPVEMLRSGDLLEPRLNLDAPHLTKPPLTYWSVAASIAVLGPSELAARLPNALAFVLTVLVVFRIGRRLVPERPWLPALVYATMPVTVLGANVVTTDTLLTLFEAAAVMYWIERRHAWLWVAFGLGFLTKGPPALLPLLAIVAFVRLRDEPLRPMFPPPGLSAFAVIGLGWFALLVARDPALAGYFVGDELIARVASDAHDRNPEWYAPFTVYLPVLAFGVLPWALATLPSWAALRGWRPFDRDRGWVRACANDPAGAFLWLWFALPLLVFCLSQSRQPGYVLPLFAPLALLLGRALAPRFDATRIGWRGLVLVAIAVPLAMKLWLPHWPYYKDTRGLAAHVAAEFAPTGDDRILFFGRWPQWGLRLYQPARVGWREANQRICDALAPAPHRTLVILWTNRPADLRPALAACGRAPGRRLASFRDMDLYAVDAP